MIICAPHNCIYRRIMRIGIRDRLKPVGGEVTDDDRDDTDDDVTKKNRGKEKKVNVFCYLNIFFIKSKTA